VPKKYRTASTRLEVDEWEKYKVLCIEKGLTPFKDLQEHIQSALKPEMEKKEIVGNGEISENQGGGEGGLSGSLQRLPERQEADEWLII